MNLQTAHSRPKNIRVQPIVIPELELRDVKWQILGADFVERADNAALEDAPKAFNRLGMNRTDNVLARSMVNGFVLELFVLVLVADPFVGAEQTHSVRDRLADELFERGSLHVLNDARHDIALAADGTDNHELARADPTSPVPVPTLVFVFVLRKTADESFVHFDNAHQLAEMLVPQSGADAMAHIPSGAVGAEAHCAVDLESGNALLARKHEMDDPEPLAQRLVGVLEDRADQMRKAVRGAVSTLHALPLPSHRCELVDVIAATTGATDAKRPAVADEIGAASVLVGKSPLPLGEGHLMDLALFLHGPESLYV